jgi:hypothetical protein
VQNSQYIIIIQGGYSSAGTSWGPGSQNGLPGKLDPSDLGILQSSTWFSIESRKEARTFLRKEKMVHPNQECGGYLPSRASHSP